MKNLWTVMFSFILVACLIQACDSDPDDLGNVVIPVYCTGDKSDDPACVNPDATESPPGDDITSESLDSGSTSSEDSGPSVECIPTYPDGTWVQCGQALYPCQLLWDLTDCTISCWKDEIGIPPAEFKKAQPDLVFENAEIGYGCVPFPGQ